MILIGKRIKELRNKYRFTQTELADKVGVTKSTIAAYENDTRLPSYDVLIKLANVFKVSIDSLLLNRTEITLDAHGLNVQQVELLEILISYFRKSNYMEDFLLDFSPNFKKHIDVYIDKKTHEFKE